MRTTSPISMPYINTGLFEMKARSYIIADLGASNGRVLLGAFDGKKAYVEPVHRFANFPVRAGGVSYWDCLYLFENIKKGINCCLGISKEVVSLSLDTWGLDFALIDPNGFLVSNPVTYRDESKNNYSPAAFHKDISLRSFFMKTGWLNWPSAPPFYLHKKKIEKSNHMLTSYKFLMMGDLFNYFLSSVLSNEYSLASNSLMLNCIKKEFDDDIIKTAGLGKDSFSRIVDPSEKIGKIKKDPFIDQKAQRVDVVACASHDSASAVCGVPASSDEDWAFVSLGTWCVAGTITGKPVLDIGILRHGLTNEAITREESFLAKNMTGLWVIQQCINRWRMDRDLDYEDIDRIYPSAVRFSGLIDLEEQCFSNICHDMPSLVHEQCLKKGFKITKDIASVSRCIYESIVLQIRYYFRLIESFSKKSFELVYLFGGGSRNRLFCQWLSDALDVPLKVSSPESASIGNMVMQLIADRQAGDIIQAREIVRDSFKIEVYEPKDPQPWKEAFETYMTKVKGSARDGIL
jgi:rhamnulokinase